MSRFDEKFQDARIEILGDAQDLRTLLLGPELEIGDARENGTLGSVADASAALPGAYCGLNNLFVSQGAEDDSHHSINFLISGAQIALPQRPTRIRVSIMSQ